jgi:hypothetical protein
VGVAVNQTLFGQPVTNVFAVEAANPGDGFTLAAIANAFIDRWVSDILPVLSIDLALVSVTATDLSVEGGQQAVIVATGTPTGGANSPSLPSSQAIVITHRTARIGRSYRGRSYLAGLPEQWVSGNNHDATRTGLLADGMNALRVDLEALSLPLCVLSRYNGDVKRAAGVLTPVVVSVARDTRVDSQRRRLP